jgi:hypothetical protein
MSWDRVKQPQAAKFPEAPEAKDSTIRLDRRAGYVDGRKAKATGRTKQFNPRVRPEFLERFQEAQAREEERAGEKITQAYFLELLLANYERSMGDAVNPFGLSEAALKGADLIADKMGWPLSQVVEDAIAARCRDFNIAKGK